MGLGLWRRLAREGRNKGREKTRLGLARLQLRQGSFIRPNSIYGMHDFCLDPDGWMIDNEYIYTDSLEETHDEIVHF